MRPSPRTGPLAVTLLALILPACGGDSGNPPAHAPEGNLVESRFWVTNTTSQAANDLHLVISGTGGTLTSPRMDPDGPHCNPPPGRPVIPPQAGNRIDVTWSSPCVQPGDTLAISVKSPFSNLRVVSVEWTLNGAPIH